RGPRRPHGHAQRGPAREAHRARAGDLRRAEAPRPLTTTWTTRAMFVRTWRRGFILAIIWPDAVRDRPGPAGGRGLESHSSRLPIGCAGRHRAAPAPRADQAEQDPDQAPARSRSATVQAQG